MTTSPLNNTAAGTRLSGEAQALLAAVQTAMPGATIPTLTTPQGRGALYEIYAWCMTWQAAREAGADQPVFCTGNGVPATAPYTFRLGPSSLGANDPFTYAVLGFSRFNNRRRSKQPLEVHLGIYICGPSDQRVQSDVCVLSQKEANYFRTPPARSRRRTSSAPWPNAHKAWITIECKCLTGNMLSRVVHEVIGRFNELPAIHHVLMVNTLSRAVEPRVIACFGPTSWQNEVVPTNQTQEQSCREMLRETFRGYIKRLQKFE